jgi:hypothetical protein
VKASEVRGLRKSYKTVLRGVDFEVERGGIFEAEQRADRIAMQGGLFERFQSMPIARSPRSRSTPRPS